MPLSTNAGATSPHAGYLRKNHQGQPYTKVNFQRWFTTEGFSVYYYDSDAKKRIRGHFDLRNVLALGLADLPTETEGAIELCIGDKSGGVAKTMIVSFAGAHVDLKVEFLKLWCSAVEPKFVDSRLAKFIDPSVSAALNTQYGSQPAVAPRMSIFGKAPTTAVLTPRSSVSMRATSGQQEASDELDTPRDTGTAARPPPASPLAARQPVPMPEGRPPELPPKAPKAPASPAVPPAADAKDDDVFYEITVR